MILKLVAMPPLLGPDDADYKGQVPTRMRFLAPDVGPRLLELNKDTGGYIYTDMWRSADSSLAARRIKRGVQRPGYSPHGYGFAVDLDLYSIMKKYKVHYADIVEVMKAHGWYCHRRDGAGPDESEAWHFNYLGTGPDKYLAGAGVDVNRPGTWANAAEARIMERYRVDFALSPTQVQSILQQLKIYGGDVDGNISSALCREAIMAFQRAWDLDVDGVAGPTTQRTLAFVTADRQITSLAPLVA